ncbi:hypothetical protein [Rhizobium ruizarguesonis]|uniref:hypothetical protein n=1 Tax=Rhizobium ruizarguesonis TaxID=2081791 RepID=UPI0013EE3F58|nr:hypothetical protein [Rhizobium ruizarguesonis]
MRTLTLCDRPLKAAIPPSWMIEPPYRLPDALLAYIGGDVDATPPDMAEQIKTPREDLA